MLGHGVGVGIAGRHQRDAAGGQRRDVEIVEPGTVAAGEAQVRRGGDDAGIERRRFVDEDYGRRISGRGQQRRPGRLRQDGDRDARGVEVAHGRRGQRSAEEDMAAVRWHDD